ncbi:hypothetical protein SRA_09131 [Streptococcus ratti FA-1 = DSM 20564]|uniref:Uncharacterized protein n=1 Tax=Streptococcus ratti FA-1 = DSM 20564 TaxID=699248 RepID=A0ABN0GXM8_STRRT|nr:hypothetical protein SRA_09131 [Streptococcus ratti FA-1 = DSM 20564]
MSVGIANIPEPIDELIIKAVKATKPIFLGFSDITMFSSFNL